MLCSVPVVFELSRVRVTSGSVSALGFEGSVRAGLWTSRCFPGKAWTTICRPLFDAWCDKSVPLHWVGLDPVLLLLGVVPMAPV